MRPLGQRLFARWREVDIERFRSGIPQIPHEPVEPGANRRAPCRWQATVIAAEARDRCARVVIKCERDRAGNALVQPVMNDRAVRGILPDVQIFATAGPVRLTEGSDPRAHSRSKSVRNAARPEAPQGSEMQLCANRCAGLKEAASVAAVDEASE